MSDLIRREDGERVTRRLVKYWSDPVYEEAKEKDIKESFNEIPSAEKPIIIRCRTFLRREDFEKFADEMKKQSDNIKVIPCDTEVVCEKRGVWNWVRFNI